MYHIVNVLNAINGKFRYMYFAKRDGTSPLCQGEKRSLRKKPIVRNIEQKNRADLVTDDRVELLNQCALGSTSRSLVIGDDKYLMV